MCATTSEIMWLVNLLALAELHINVSLPVNLFCDYLAAISIVVNPCFHERTKHFKIDLFFLTDKISKGIIKTIAVKTDK